MMSIQGLIYGCDMVMNDFKEQLIGDQEKLYDI
jgi:hypothetical protein